MKVIIYTDGGCDPNPGIGGWAAVLRYGGHEKVLTGNDPDATNNRMELTAAIEALGALTRPTPVTLYTDSEYLRRGITEWIEGWIGRGWKRSDGKPVPNVDLWQKLIPLTETHDIEWNWVRGHTGDPLNEKVDRLAREARLEITPGLDLETDAPQLYVRASCKGNPGPGGWGVVMEYDDVDRQSSGNIPTATNNQMEITAVIEALAMIPPNSDVQIYTTSDYVYQGATQWIHGWRKRNWVKRDGKPVANAELWQKLDQRMGNYRIQFINAKGKQFDQMDIAAKIAKQAVAELVGD